MKPIFSSLGSNYTVEFALQAASLVFRPLDTKKVGEQLTATLHKAVPQLSTQPAFFYKGRDAITYALNSLGVGVGDIVLSQAFSCHALEAAIRRSGARTVYVDLEHDSLQPSLRTLESAYKNHPKARALIIQHSLGYPADMPKIRKWCKSQGIFLIEDLAQAVGGSDAAGIPLGSDADAVVCSFGRDKVIDAVNGGVAWVPHSHTAEVSKNFYELTSTVFATDLVYPLLTWLIRTTYPIGLGKLVLYVSKRLNWITSPVSSRFEHTTALPVSLAVLAVQATSKLNEKIEHRRKIALTYQKRLHGISLVDEKLIAAGSCLRFPIVVSDPIEVIRKLAAANIFVADRWYRAAVDSGALNYPTVYKAGSCPNAESLAEKILTLPTHQGVEIKDAERIADCILDERK